MIVSSYVGKPVDLSCFTLVTAPPASRHSLNEQTDRPPPFAIAAFVSSSGKLFLLPVRRLASSTDGGALTGSADGGVGVHVTSLRAPSARSTSTSQPRPSATSTAIV